MSARGIEITRLPEGWGERLRVEVRSGPTRSTDAAIDEAAWARLCADNPRLHDGLILAVDHVDVAAATMRCSIATYRQYAVQRDTAVGDRGIRLLGVKGLLVDSAGRILLGKRSGHSWAYPGTWEAAPAGGVTPPGAPGLAGVGLLARALALEAGEELGLALPAESLRPAWIIADEEARSVDVVLGAALRAGGGANSWEYPDVRWCDARDMRSLPLSPPTAALLASGAFM